MNDATRSTAPLKLILPAVALPVFLAVSTQTMIAVLLPPIGADLGELERLPWLVIGYVLALTIAGPVYGALGDMHGRKAMLILSLCIYAAGSIICALAPVFEVLAFGRLVQGFGGGGLMTLSQAIIGQTVTDRQRGKVQGYVATIGVVASTAGPLLAGIFADALGWRSLFFLAIPLAFLGMLLLVRIEVAHRNQPAGAFDLSGFLWLNVFVCSIIIGLELLNTPGRGVLAALLVAAAAVGLVGLILAERRATNPLFPPSLLSRPAILRAYLLSGFHGGAFVSLAAFVPLFLRIVHGQGTLDAAVMLLALTGGLGLGGFATGHLITATGRTALFPSVGLIAATISIASIGIAGAHMPGTALAILLILAGIGMGTVMSVVHTTVQQAAPAALRGAAAGGVTFARNIGSAIGTTAVSLVLFTIAAEPATGGAASVLVEGPSTADPAAALQWQTAFQAAFLTVALFTFAAWVMAVSTPARRV